METPINVPTTYPNIPTRIPGVTNFFCPMEAAIGAATEGPIIFAAEEITTSYTSNLKSFANASMKTKWKIMMVR